MSPSLRRILIPLVVLAMAAGVVLSMVFRAPPKKSPPLPSVESASAPAEQPAAGAPVVPAEVTTEADAAAPTLPDDPGLLQGLRARAPAGGISEPGAPLQTLGSLDPRIDTLQLTFSRIGAGIEDIRFSDQWVTADAKNKADAHYRAIERGETNVPPLPDERWRYVLCRARAIQPGLEIPVLAAQSLLIDEQLVHLIYDLDEATGERREVWTEIAPGSFQTEIVNEQGQPITRVTRTYELGTGNDLTLQQTVQNLTARALTIQWLQYGPSDLPSDISSTYIDRRRFRFGYLLSPQRDPTRQIVLAEKNVLIERADVFKKAGDPLWPNKTSLDRGYELSWFASTNRYFALAIHPVLDELQNGGRSLTKVVERIGHRSTGNKATEAVIFTQLYSPLTTVGAAAVASFDMGVFAGPLDPKLLDNQQPYKSLSMGELVLYQMSSCCAICTFQWLAHGLIRFLSLVHLLLGDWGIAIVLLVCVVRTLLHPLTKRAQINMHGFSTTMSDLKPELEKLQQKYKDDPKKFQAEQLKLMREKGLNPLQFLGCLPMFLQTPIWIALYAMLYFAYEIRQQPAFYGIFQKISGDNWPFLSDLSSPDRFIPLFDTPQLFHFGFIFDYSSINLLPLAMGILFFLQQKYMTPPPNPSMSKEQIQQQKIMKVMMVGMMPLVLYSAPSGLTLYILTSSTIGILEGRYVRNHIKELANKPPAPKKNSKTKTKPRDTMGRAYASALERMQEKQKARSRPQKSFKKKKR